MNFLRKIPGVNYLYHRFVTKCYYLDTKLARGDWYDTDTRLLHAMMNALIDFVEKEKPFETHDYDFDKRHRKIKKDIEEIYNWWKSYPSLEKEIDDKLTEWNDLITMTVVDGKVVFESRKGENKVLLELHNLEETLVKQETNMMVKLVKIRSSLWT